MKLNAKILLLIVLMWGFMLLITYLGSQRILVNSYLQLESNHAQENLNRINRAIDSQLSVLSYLLLTYAVWDDSYQFIKDKNQAYIKGNLTANALNIAKIEMELWFDPNGKLFYSVALSPDKTKLIPLPKDIISLFKQGAPLHKMLYQPSLTSSTKGLVAISSGLLFVVAHSITTSNGLAPPHGTLVMARYFSNDILEQISQATKLNIKIYRLPLALTETNLQNVFFALKNQHTLYLELNDKTLDAYELLKNINGLPIAIIKMSMPRSLYLAGIKTIRDFGIAFIISGIIFACLLYFLLSHLIISRLTKITEKVIEVGETKNLSLRIREEGNDELHIASLEINKMLEAIEEYDKQKDSLLHQVNYELDRASLFSNKLEIVEAFLASVINSMPSSIVITDDKINIIQLNSLAEKEINQTSDEAKNQSLFNIFPYLLEYRNKFLVALKQKKPQIIDKITDAKKNNVRYFHVVIYPISMQGENCLAVRIDDATDEMLFENKMTHNAKLISIGILTASVAHEISSPINFVSAAVPALRNNILEIVHLLNQYSEIKSAADYYSKIAEIKAMQDTTNVSYLIDEINCLINGIKNSANRTSTIINNLKAFSQFNEDYMKKANIHEIVDSTLNLLRYKYSDTIIIIKDYEKIPDIICYPGKLSQALMSIISNAIEAIVDKGEINIRTRKVNDKIEISINDTGVGISAENIKRIFDPFFTTKEVGKGTGLNLAVTSAIIQEHNGSIDVRSQLGLGAEFIITLPIEQTNE